VPILIEESSETGERHWLQSIVDTEQIEGALLRGSGSGDEVEGHWVVGGGQDAVFGDGRQVAQQGVKAVEWSVLGGEFGAGFALRTRGALGGSNH